MDKRKITAREILKDIRGGASDSDLMNKYTVSAQGLQSVFNKLVNSGVVTQSELDDRVPVSERTVDLGLYICPACGNIQGKEFVVCPRCNFTAPQRSRQSAATPEVQDKKPAARPPAGPHKTQPRPPRTDSPTTSDSAQESVRSLGRVATYCRVLAIAVFVAYVLIIAGAFAAMHVSDQGINPASMEFMAVTLMGIPALVIAFILLVILKALTESVRVYSEVTTALSKNLPTA
ncbi:MAG TPA: hypothetical protein VK463_11185 [Desulfomonilaceae bacterium]|nr:hypothetical protein [Desulfomonilaceae bacterium]